MTSLNMADPRKTNEDYARPTAGEATAPAAKKLPLRFRPRWLPTLLAMLLLPLFIACGQWQWNKAGAKGDLQALLDARSAEAPVRLSASPADAQALRYRRVSVRGSYEPAHQILIDNRIHRQQPGYHVVTPLRIENSAVRVLVNRGWIPALAEHRQVPQVSTPDGLVEVSGMAVVPGTRFFTLGSDIGNGRGEWQSVWQNLDLGRYAKAVDFPLQPVVIQLAEDSPTGGFARAWPRPAEKLEMHLGYAFQWWGFAAATAIIWLVVNFRRERDPPDSAR